MSRAGNSESRSYHQYYRIQFWGQGRPYTPNTAHALSEIKRDAKIKHFEIDDIPPYFDPTDFGKFAKVIHFLLIYSKVKPKFQNNFACKCDAYLHFKSGISRLALNNFKKATKPYIHDHKFRSKPPSLTMSLHQPTAFTISDWSLSMKQYTRYKFDKQFLPKKWKKKQEKVRGFKKCLFP